MLPVYVLWSALAASAVLGRSSQPARVTYGSSELQALKDRTAVVGGVTADGGARTANLKFVLAIRRSTMWTDVKRRTVKISTDPRLTALLDADPDSLSDDDLALLKRACHDGLKCVAVDQLLVLRRATETLPNGLVAVRQAITKITHVLTNYTTEYYEDTYQYAEVSETDDPAKLAETVTVIVEDNKELCRIRVGDDVAVTADETVSTTVARDAKQVARGTASVRLDGGDSAAAKTAEASAAPAVQEIEIDAGGDSDDDSAAAKNPAEVRAPSKARENRDLLRREARVGGQAYRGGGSAKRDAAAAVASTFDHGRRGGAGDGEDDDDDDDDDEDDDDDDDDDDEDAGPGHNRSVKIGGGDDDGDSLTKTDVASAGDNNAASVKKGYVEDGVMNNGDMTLYNVNTGTINKGIVNRSGADGGIVNVGTLNNGPTNYGTANSNENFGTVATMNDTDMKQYMSSIDRMYSTIINNMAAKQ